MKAGSINRPGGRASFGGARWAPCMVVQVAHVRMCSLVFQNGNTELGTSTVLRVAGPKNISWLSMQSPEHGCWSVESSESGGG